MFRLWVYNMSIRILGSFQHAEKAEEKRMQLHVVLAQVTPNEMGKGDVRAILPRMRELTEIAARQGADVIVFPEYFLTGSSHEAWHQVRWHDPINSKEEDPDWLAIIQEMARTNEIAIVTGSAVVLHDDDPTQQLYNITYFIDYRGRIRGSYTKRHLWHAERAILSNATDESHPAKDYPPLFLFKTKRGLKLRASMLMCVRIYQTHRSGTSCSLNRSDVCCQRQVVFRPTWMRRTALPARMWCLRPRVGMLTILDLVPLPGIRTVRRRVWVRSKTTNERRCVCIACDGKRVLCMHVQCSRSFDRLAAWTGTLELQCTFAGMQCAC